MNYNKSLFEGVPKKNPNKSFFNLSHEYKAAIVPGRIIPVLTMEVMPGDYFTDIDTEFFFRFLPLYYPVMQKFTMRADYFYVPNRILWPKTQGAFDEEVGWESWIMNQSSEFAHPYMTAKLTFYSSLWNGQVLGFMGLPLIDSTTVDANTDISNLNALPLSAYLKIWDEYYRNPQLESAKWFYLTAGDNTSQFTTAFASWYTGSLTAGLYWCAPTKWEMDYFTSALPTPQIGEAILIPSLGMEDDGTLKPQNIVNADGTPAVDGTLTIESGTLGTSATANPVMLETQATIKQLRLAEVLQSYYERIMKVGQRYRDFIAGLFGHDPQPMAVDVPVLIGSKFGRVQISDVTTMAYTTQNGARQTGDYTGQAALYEQGGQSFRYHALEHGWLMCLLQVNANTSYGQGIERFWRRSVPTDYPLDMFSGIGDQEILKEEVLYNPITTFAAKNQETFGYIPRFSEMRYVNNKHIGALNYTFGLSMHGGRYWSAQDLDETSYNDLEIGADFVTASKNEYPNQNEAEGRLRLVDMFRSLPSAGEGDPAEAVIFAHLFHTVKVNRQLPVFSTPKL